MEYASPEQVRGVPATQASDVHGLGLVFYEMLLDRRPFELGSLPIYEAGRVVCERTPDLADLTPRLAGVVGKAIRKNPPSVTPAFESSRPPSKTMWKRQAGNGSRIARYAGPSPPRDSWRPPWAWEPC
jgi:serine/threonine protein kinase